MKYYVTRYTPSHLRAILYMLQNTEFQLGEYLSWYNRTRDFRRVIKRRQLELTPKIKLLRMGLIICTVILADIIIALTFFGVTERHIEWVAAGLLLLVVSPFILAYGVTIPLAIGWALIQKPSEFFMVRRAKKVLANHPAIRIGIAGSFGKTTAKEVIKTVLAEGKKVAATPGNMNTAIGISRFVMTLHGDEDVLVFEYGEEKVGDVRKLARLTRPTIGIMTGANEAHLNSFKSLDRTVSTILELADFVEPDALYVNGESALLKKAKIKGHYYDRHGVESLKVMHAETSVSGASWNVTLDSQPTRVETGLIGLHTIGVATVAAAIAHRLGLSVSDIKAGLRSVHPFEHRMESKPFHGAWIIDDTYNGNTEGVGAGLAFLKSVDAKRRVYVTPGLVELGDRTEKIHKNIGAQIAESADMVVLMQNSVTDYIKAGLEKGKFKGHLIEIGDPLEFYTNLDQYVAAGDVVLMQNDWTDNYY